MPRVDCLGIEGVEAVFYSRDHRPPHFHVIKRGQWEARIYFLEPMAEMVEFKGTPKHPNAR